MQLKQINCDYSQIEDRLLVRINTTDHKEYRLWFSRLITKTILGGTRHLYQVQLEKTSPKETAAAILDFKTEALKETVKYEANFDSPPSVEFPLGDKPVYVKNITITAKQNTMEYVLELENQLTMNFTLEEQAVESLNLLLEDFSRRANWWSTYSLSTPTPSPVTVNESNPSGTQWH